MKKYGVAVLILFLGVILGCNYFLNSLFGSSYNKEYKVEINRILNDINEYGYGRLDLSKYKFINSVEILNENEEENKIEEFYRESNEEYVILKQGEILIRFNYMVENNGTRNRVLILVNSTFAVILIFILAFVIWLDRKVIVPFNRVNNIPIELSKGNLVAEIPEQKNKLFGKFIWGINMLRENLEDYKQKELSLQKEKKTLILSISHDIKTPLSLIKLYSKALKEDLYSDEDKRKKTAMKIDEKADEIRNFMDEIIKASSEDFLNLSVNCSEIYLTDLIDAVVNYYTSKLEILRIKLNINSFSNCLIFGDFDRCIEIFQNIIENAIKYGDGRAISIDFEREDDCQIIKIINSGNTLESREVVHVFDSFWRGSNIRNEQGNGLGLYICRQLVNRMGGEIYAEIKGEHFIVTVILKLV
jgi:signal transduction histidine kinase